MVKSVSFFLNSCIDIVIWTLCKFLAHHVQKRTLSSMYYQFAASPSRLKLTSNLSSPAMLLVTWQMSLSLQMYRSLVSLYRQRILVRADGERLCRRWWVQLTQLRPTRILKLTHQGTAPERSLYPQLLCCYSAPGSGGGVLWWACLSVCLCVCLSAIISPELQTRSSPSFFVPVTYDRGSILL